MFHRATGSFLHLTTLLSCSSPITNNVRYHLTKMLQENTHSKLTLYIGWVIAFWTLNYVTSCCTLVGKDSSIPVRTSSPILRCGIVIFSVWGGCYSQNSICRAYIQNMFTFAQKGLHELETLYAFSFYRYYLSFYTRFIHFLVITSSRIAHSDHLIYH